MLKRAALAVGVVVALQSAGAQRAAPAYRAAEIDAQGNLRIVTSDANVVVISKSPRLLRDDYAFMGPQTSFGDPVLSDDHRAVAAPANFANCCTSYDIPMQLVVVFNGITHRFEGSLPIGDFHFVDGSRRIAFGAEPVHFGCAVYWELHDIATERLVASRAIPEPCGQIPNPEPVDIPSWVSGSASGIE